MNRAGAREQGDRAAEQASQKEREIDSKKG